MSVRSRHAIEPESALPTYLAEADRILAAALAEFQGETAAVQVTPYEPLRWFPLPCEVLRELAGGGPPPPSLVLAGR
jgi:hypothetical protein